MATPSLIAPIVNALEKEVGVLAVEQKATIETFVDTIADNNVNAAVTAIADHINLHGLAGLEQNPIRNALTGAEPALDGIVNNDIDGAYTAFETMVTNLAATKP
jgi:hypothetical protein